MTAKWAILMAVVALVVSASAAGARARKMGDGILSMPLPHGWTGSVSYGGRGGWPNVLLAGNFHLPRNAAGREECWGVPAHRAQIRLLDFPGSRAVPGDPRVKRLRLPHKRLGFLTRWHVRFEGRALVLQVHFGSRPNAHMRHVVNRRLATVRRID